MKIATVNIENSVNSLVSLRLNQAPGYNCHRGLSRGLCHLMEWYVIFNQSSINRLQFDTARINNQDYPPCGAESPIM